MHCQKRKAQVADEGILKVDGPIHRCVADMLEQTLGIQATEQQQEKHQQQEDRHSDPSLEAKLKVGGGSEEDLKKIKEEKKREEEKILVMNASSICLNACHKSVTYDVTGGRRTIARPWRLR